MVILANCNSQMSFSSCINTSISITNVSQNSTVIGNVSCAWCSEGSGRCIPLTSIDQTCRGSAPDGINGPHGILNKLSANSSVYKDHAPSTYRQTILVTGSIIYL